MNFNASSDKSENLHFNVLLWLKVYYVWVKKVQRVMCHNTGEELWRRTKFEEELTSAFENEVFHELWPNAQKPQNLPFNWLLLTKVHNVKLKKIDEKFEGKMNGGFINDMRDLVNLTGELKNLKMYIWIDFFVQVYNVELKNYKGVRFHET